MTEYNVNSFDRYTIDKYYDLFNNFYVSTLYRMIYINVINN